MSLREERTEDVLSARAERGDESLARLLMLSDGIFAIATTLLVLEITIPTVTGTTFAQRDASLVGALASMFPDIMTYALSFIIVGVFWKTHQRIFHYVVRADGPLTWLNLFFLMAVAFVPVPTKILGEYGDHGAAVRFYAGSLLVGGLLIVALWVYATMKHRLVAADLEGSVIRHHVERSLIAPAVFVLAGVISYANPALAENSLVLVAFAIAIHERRYRWLRARQMRVSASAR